MRSTYRSHKPQRPADRSSKPVARPVQQAALLMSRHGIRHVPLTEGGRVVSLRRASGKPGALADDTVLEGGDTLVISGKAPALALAEDKLLSG